MSPPRRRRVLVSAYACEPGMGSEPGVGWNWAVQIARFHETWVITRRNNSPAIEAALREKNIPRLHPVYFDLERWAGLFKRGQRGTRLYYFMWQIGVYFVARRLHRKVGFDLVHHVTFVNYWLPIGIVFLPLPLVLGPAGGGESCPRSLRRSLGWRGRTYELLRSAARWQGEHGVFARMAARRAGLAMATTPESARRMARLGFRRVLVASQMGMGDDELALLGRAPFRTEAPFRLASIGRLLHWKGYHFGIEAFARLQERCRGVEYWVIGDGPERKNLERLALERGVADKVRFYGALGREQAMARLARCDALLHPSLHDSGGWVCLEAMAARRPVVCLDLGGPGLLNTDEAGFKIRAASEQQVVEDIAGALRRLAEQPELRRQKGEAARARVMSLFHWDIKGGLMRDRYSEVVAR